MAAVFAMQGIGILFAGVVAVATMASFKHLIEEDPQNLDYVWRICLVQLRRKRSSYFKKPWLSLNFKEIQLEQQTFKPTLISNNKVSDFIFVPLNFIFITVSSLPITDCLI